MESRGDGIKPNSGINKTDVKVRWCPPGFFTGRAGDGPDQDGILWNWVEDTACNAHIMSKENITNLRKYF